MEKIIIEVGSNNTKIDKVINDDIERLGVKVIEFKRNYDTQTGLKKEDINTLINLINELNGTYDNIYVCGTSIFRKLTDEQRENFLQEFKNATNFTFNIISQDEENRLTVIGAAKNAERKVAVFVGGGGSTEIAIYDNKVLEMANSDFGVVDIINKFPDLYEDIATTTVEEVAEYIRKDLKLPSIRADILILAGGGHKLFALNSGISYTKNTLYEDKYQPIMMNIETRTKDTQRFFKEISLDEIRKRVEEPKWWDATRAMSAIVLEVAKEMGVKYIIPTDISMTNGIIQEG